MTLTASSNSTILTTLVTPTVAGKAQQQGESGPASDPPVRRQLGDTSQIPSFIEEYRENRSLDPASARTREALLRSGFSAAPDAQQIGVAVNPPILTKIALESVLRDGGAVHIPTAAFTFNKNGYGGPTTLGFTSAILTAESTGAYRDSPTGALPFPIKLRVFDRDTFIDYAVIADPYASTVDITTSHHHSHTFGAVQSEAVQLLNFKIAVKNQGDREGKHCSLLEIHLPANSILTRLSPVAAATDLEQFAAQSSCVVDTTLHQPLKDYFTQLGVDPSAYLHLHNKEARLRISIPKDGSETAIITTFNSDGAPVPLPLQLTNQTPSLSADIVNKALGFEHGYTQRTGSQEQLHERWSRSSEVLAIPCKIPFTETAQKIRSWCDTCSKAIEEFSIQEYHGNLRSLLLTAHTDARREIAEYANDLQGKLQQSPYMSLQEVSTFLTQLQGLCETSLVVDDSRPPVLADGRPTRLWYKAENDAFSLQVYRPQHSTVVDYTLSFNSPPEAHDRVLLNQTIASFPSDSIQIKAPFIEDARSALLKDEAFTERFSLTFQDLPTFARFMFSYDQRASILSELPESILQMRQRQHDEGLRYIQERANAVASTVRAYGTILETQLIAAITTLNDQSGLDLHLGGKSHSAGSPYDDQRFEFCDRENKVQLEVVRSWSSREITCNLRIDSENTPATPALRKNSSLRSDPNVTVRSARLEDITAKFFSDEELSGPCYIRNVGNLAQTFRLLSEIGR